MLTKKQIDLANKLRKPVEEVLKDDSLRYEVAKRNDQAILLVKKNHNPFSKEGLYLGIRSGRYQFFIVEGSELRHSFIPEAGSDKVQSVRSNLWSSEVEEYLATRGITPLKLTSRVIKHKYKN